MVLPLNEVQIAVLYTTFTAVCLSLVVMMNRFDTEWTSSYTVVSVAFLVLSLVAFFIITRVKKREIHAIA